MTLASAVNSVSYAGNGSTTSFPISFYFLDAADIRAILRDNATGDETEWSQPADFTVSGAGNPSGGTLSAAAAPASGKTLFVYREVPIVQPVDYVENDAFPAESHERALDRLTMIAQQIASEIGRSFRLQKTDPTTSIELPDVATRKGKYLYFDPATGDPSVAEVVTVGAIVVSAFWQGILDENNAAASRALLDAAALATANTFTADQTVKSTDAGAGVGPLMRLFRDSASPGASDLLAALLFDGRSSTAQQRTYARVLASILDATNAGEDAVLQLQTIVAGALATRLNVGQGLWTNSATGGDKGADSVNAKGFYRDGTALALQRLFESGEIAIAVTASGSVAHGLGAAPKLALAYLRCKTADANYSVGDEICLGGGVGSDGDGSGFNYGVTYTTDASNIVYRQGAGRSGAVFNWLDKTTGVFTQLTNARWKLFFRAWG